MKVLNRYDFLIEMRGEGIEKKALGYLFSVLIFYHVLFGVGRFLCEGFQYDCGITSKKHGWVKQGKDYYFIIQGKTALGKITYKGQRYYSTKNGKRYIGWLKSGGKAYYITGRMALCSVTAGLLEQNTLLF